MKIKGLLPVAGVTLWLGILGLVFALAKGAISTAFAGICALGLFGAWLAYNRYVGRMDGT